MEIMLVSSQISLDIRGQYPPDYASGSSPILVQQRLTDGCQPAKGPCSRDVSALASRAQLMATTLAPVDSREVVRCDRCHLVQFRTTNTLCRKCRTSLDAEEPEPVLLAPAPASEPANGNGHAHLQIASAIRSLRHRTGLSQRQLAMRMQVPRTYVSKIENEKATPTLSSLARLAAALEVSVPDLLVQACGPSREGEINEALADPFVAELAAFTSQLNAMQLANVLSQVRDMVEHPRRYTQN